MNVFDIFPSRKSQQLSDHDTVGNYSRFSEKYLSPELFSIFKSQIN